MDLQKVYVGQDNRAVFVCPHCGNSKTADAGKYMDRKGPLKVRCTCGLTFSVSLEFRRAYRKETTLVGHYCKLPGCMHWEEMVVKNISPSGLGFTALSPHDLTGGCLVRVRFRLDDAKRSEIEKDVVVKEVKQDHVGCKFTAPLQFSQADKALGFYLMP